MKIQSIRFKNLNSLSGEWYIDFTSPEYLEDGIFAITGPTGAGKSTILDAICLALYGRTPRLDKVTKSSNEIMSRMTAECFSEVLFATKSGTYLCRWYQHRARLKVDGDLQDPKHEISDATSEKILESQKNLVVQAVEKVTGMDFDRFTRSMLLAQGGFASFLQAKPSEKAPILEQITGTEIYAQISMKVHEIRGLEQNKLDEMCSAIAELNILSAEDEETLAQETKETSEKISVTLKKMQEGETLLAWLNKLQSLKSDIANITHANDLLAKKEDAFKDKQERLERANRALELSGDYARLDELRSDLIKDELAQESLLKEKPILEAKKNEASALLSERKKKLIACSDESFILLPKIKQARALDVKINSLENEIQRAETELESLNKEYGEIEGELDASQQLLDDFSRRLIEIDAKLTKTKDDEKLVGNLSAIHAKVERYLELNNELEVYRKSLCALAEQIKTSKIEVDISGKDKDALEDKLKTITITLASKNEELTLLLHGNSKDALQEEHKAALLRKEKISHTLSRCKELDQSLSEIDRLKQNQSSLQKESQHYAETVQSLAQKINLLEEEQVTAQKNLLHFNAFKSFDSSREELLDGSPCPLCGSIEHPYVVDKPSLNKAEDTYKELNTSLDSAKSEYNAAYKVEAQISANLQNAIKEISQADSRIAILISRIEEEDKESSLSIKNIGDYINDQHNKLDAYEALISKLAKTIEQALKIEQEVILIKKSSEQEIEKLSHAEKDHLEKELIVKQFTKEHINSELEINKITLSLASIFDNLSKIFSEYGLGVSSIESLNKALIVVDEKKATWEKNKAESLNLQQKKTQFSDRIMMLKPQLSNKKSTIEFKNNQLDISKKNDLSLISERQSLLGILDADKEEERLSQEKDKASILVEEYNITMQEINEALLSLESVLSKTNADLIVKKDKTTLQTEHFLTLLKKSNFDAELEYLEACMPDAERNVITSEAKQLAQEKHLLLANKSEKTMELLFEQERKLTELKEEEINEQTSKAKEGHNTLQQVFGKLKHQKDEHERQKSLQQDRLIKISNQKTTVDRWSRLHQLIGSADGKKFRNFAQGLTFEVMLRHANRHLEKMTDRYLLSHDKELPLELNVIDNYQAGEVRSVRNLSGGESFIVSLSLALGLSKMTSKNVRVDSLFLDEGFGALDEDTLDTALETLVALKEDGKLIGVISHVGELKTRLSTQIQVTSLSDGKSSISGPGCQRIIR